MLVAVTDHAAERFRQRVGGSLDPKREVARRVGEALQAGLVSDQAPPGARATRGSVYVGDTADRSLVYVCRPGDGELIVVTLWERADRPAPPRVPREYTDALRDKRR